MNEFDELLEAVARFRDERDWGQFHNEKDLALSIVLESAELLELFQWKSPEQALEKNEGKFEDELADVLLYCFMLADKLGVDPAQIMRAKLRKNEEKYPVSKAFGKSDKYSELNEAAMVNDQHQ